MKFRDYQEYAIASIFRYFEQGGKGNPIVAMPTGTGKSVVIGGFIREAMLRYPGQRIVMLTHVKELIEQNYEKLLALWPTAPAGVYSAGLRRREVGFPITFAGIATVAKRAKQFGHVDLVLIDEAHLVSPKAGTMYRQFLSELYQVNPALKVIGFTATHYRMGQGLLTDAGGIFTDICVDMTQVGAFNWFISEGYLCPLVPKRTSTELDVEHVKIQQGEYNLKQLQETVDKEEITYAALREALDQSVNRNHWLVFASGVQHAVNVAEMLDSMGVSATYVHSRMSTRERDQRIADFKAGKYTAMVNNGILTTGFDFPGIDLIIMLRPTRSPGLWVQMLGRGTRPVYAPGYDLTTTEGRLAAIAASPKQNCLVLDFAGNTKRLGPINDPVLPRRKGGGLGRPAPVKTCDHCGTYCHASVRICPECRAEFPVTIKLSDKASTDELIADGMPVVESFKVDRVVYNRHEKEGRPPSLRVTYYCGLRMFKEWVALEHGGYAGKRGRDWWRQRAPKGTTPPATVAEALERISELRTPRELRVWINKKYPEVMGATFEGEDEQISSEAPVR